jgi:hypothetical protein
VGVERHGDSKTASGEGMQGSESDKCRCRRRHASSSVSPLPGLTRQFINFEKILAKMMDARVKPAYGAEYVAGFCANFRSTISNSHASAFSRRKMRPSFADHPRDSAGAVERREAPECLRGTL